MCGIWMSFVRLDSDDLSIKEQCKNHPEQELFPTVYSSREMKGISCRRQWGNPCGIPWGGPMLLQRQCDFSCDFFICGRDGRTFEVWHWVWLAGVKTGDSMEGRESVLRDKSWGSRSSSEYKGWHFRSDHLGRVSQNSWCIQMASLGTSRMTRVGKDPHLFIEHLPYWLSSSFGCWLGQW